MLSCVPVAGTTASARYRREIPGLPFNHVLLEFGRTRFTGLDHRAPPVCLAVGARRSLTSGRQHARKKTIEESSKRTFRPPARERAAAAEPNGYVAGTRTRSLPPATVSAQLDVRPPSSHLHLGKTSVHKQFRSGDVAAVVGREKHHGFRDLVCGPEPAERNILGNRLQTLLARF